MPPLTIPQALDLATGQYRGGNMADAEALCRQVLACQPNNPHAFQLLGMVLSVLGRLDESVEAFNQALLLDPKSAETWNNLATVLRRQSKPEEAVAAYQRALAIRPDFAEAHYNLANALKDRGQLDHAEAEYRQALTLRPNFAEAYGNLGTVLKDSGRIEEAVASYRRAEELKPDPSIGSSLLCTLHYSVTSSREQLWREHVRWNNQYVAPLGPSIQPHHNDRSAGRRLRIGYVSGDLSEHPVGRYVLPLLSHHDHAQFEVLCYSDVRKPDAVTQKLQSHADVWRNTSELSDVRLAELVRQDRTDILIDLALHTAENRLMVFARRPAPVQLTFAGYPSTTGMDVIQYRLSDRYLDPLPSGDRFYSERTVRLPDSFWCYGPLSNELQVNALPALQKGFLTFGCLNNLCKINDPLLDLWGRVLCQVSGSRLIVRAPSGSARQRLLDALQYRGVGPNRVEIVGSRPRLRYLELYHRIDLSLDTFPYNGHTTSIDSLWMGVPLVSLSGTTAVSRGGLSILSNLGLPELAADTPEQYVRLAVDLARDLPRLSELRCGLRGRMEASPLMDQPRYARAIEAVYRMTWEKWCSQGP